MKSIFLTITLAILTVAAGYSQKYNKAKNLYTQGKVNEAVTEIEGVIKDPKQNTNSDVWYLRAQIYSNILKDESRSQDKEMARENIWESLEKYFELEDKKDASKRYLMLTLDNRQPLVDLYTSHSADGAAFYNANNFQDALKNFQKSLKVFELMTEKGFIEDYTMDTLTTLYAGISAEKANDLDAAANYYSKLADAKATEEGFVELYKWLADHYYKRKNDIATSTKYLNLGRELYPEEEFWDVYELDMLREQEDKTALFNKYEEIIRNNPNDYLNKFNYAVELYQIANNPDSAARPANAKELLEKAKEQLISSLQDNPDFPNSNLVLAQIYYNEGVDIVNENAKIRPAAGGRLTAEQTKEKERLRELTNQKYDQAKVYLEKIEQVLGSQGKLKGQEKMILRDAYDMLIIIYEQKRDKDKANAYTEKYNNVDKDH
jgi:hypothetical protein